MMKYLKNPVTDVVYGYDTSIDHQVEHMNARIADENLVDVTDNWPPPEVVPVPVSITRPQAAKQLYVMDLISAQEALAMSQSGVAPPFVMEQISLLEAKDQILAQIDFARYTFERNHPLLNALMAANGHTSEEIDDFFRAAGAL